MIVPVDADSPIDLPELIPVRMLNEFAYCGRLAYLEWVQGEWADNLDTRAGTFAHRNVDRPTRGGIPLPDSPRFAGARVVNGTVKDETDEDDETESDGQDADAIHARSLTLSAPTEGLIARPDLLELDGQAALPVDYKRSRVPDVPGDAYEPERVQLCDQGLILREAGYRCDAGLIYYVESRRRVAGRFDDALVARTRELARQLRETAAAGVLSPPLVDSPKCPRCALVGICLPDETNLLRRDETSPESVRPVRRLLPARDDALPLYLQTQGVVLGKRGETLTIGEKGKTLRTVKLKDVSQNVYGKRG